MRLSVCKKTIHPTLPLGESRGTRAEWDTTLADFGENRPTTALSWLQMKCFGNGVVGNLSCQILAAVLTEGYFSMAAFTPAAAIFMTHANVTLQRANVLVRQRPLACWSRSNVIRHRPCKLDSCGCRPTGLKTATLVDGYVDDHGTWLHQSQIIATYQVRRLCWYQYGSDYQISQFELISDGMAVI